MANYHFLDSRNIKNSNKLTFGTYTKPTHKINSLVNRLLSTPLQQTEYTKEYIVLNIAIVNGFNKKLVDKEITRFRRFKYINHSSGYFHILLAMYCRTTYNDASA